MIKYIDKDSYGLLEPEVINYDECFKKGYITEEKLNEK